MIDYIIVDNSMMSRSSIMCALIDLSVLYMTGGLVRGPAGRPLSPEPRAQSPEPIIASNQQLTVLQAETTSLVCITCVA